MKKLLDFALALLGFGITLSAAENLIEDPAFKRIGGREGYWRVSGNSQWQTSDDVFAVKHEKYSFCSLQSALLKVPVSASPLKISVDADCLAAARSRRFGIALNGKYADGTPIGGTLSVLNLPQITGGFRKMEKIFTPVKAVKSLQVEIMLEMEGSVRLRNIALVPVRNAVEYDASQIVCNYPGSLGRAPGTDLRILSYNILAKCWGRQSPPAEARAPEIIEIIRNIRPDIAGLQELDPIWYKMLSGRIDPWKFAVDPYDSNMCAVIYDSRRFRQVGGDVIAFTDLLLRCLRWTLLEEIPSGRKILITNTHWDLTSPKRMQNSRLMVKYLTELRKRFPDAAVFCTGDFNSTRDSGEFKNLLANTPLSDAVSIAPKTENASIGSWISPKIGKVRTSYSHIDHILVSPGVKVLQAKLFFGQLPLTASDHLPLIADVRFSDSPRTMK